MASYLLLETGDKLILEDGSGDLLLEGTDQTIPLPVKFVGKRHKTDRRPS